MDGWKWHHMMFGSVDGVCYFLNAMKGNMDFSSVQIVKSSSGFGLFYYGGSV